MRKKIGLIAATAALGALLVVGGTLAWFTDTETATNVVTTGNVQIAIQENGDKMDPGERLTFAGAQTPGQSLDKKVEILNIGKNDAYIRVKIVNDAGLELSITDDTNWIPEDDYYYYLLPVKAELGFTTALLEEVKIPSDWTNDAVDMEYEVKINAEAIQSDNLFGADEDVTADTLAAKFGDTTIIPYEAE